MAGCDVSDMPEDEAPKTDAERIAALEKAVSELQQICANLFNGTYSTMRIAIEMPKLLSLSLTRRPVPDDLPPKIEKANTDFNTAMAEVRKMLWGPPDGEV